MQLYRAKRTNEARSFVISFIQLNSIVLYTALSGEELCEHDGGGGYKLQKRERLKWKVNETKRHLF